MRPYNRQILEALFDTPLPVCRWSWRNFGEFQSFAPSKAAPDGFIAGDRVCVELLPIHRFGSNQRMDPFEPRRSGRSSIVAWRVGPSLFPTPYDHHTSAPSQLSIRRSSKCQNDGESCLLKPAEKAARTFRWTARDQSVVRPHGESRPAKSHRVVIQEIDLKPRHRFCFLSDVARRAGNG